MPYKYKTKKKEYMKKYYQKNKDKIKEYHKEYYKKPEVKKNPRKRKDCPLCRRVDGLAEIKIKDLK